MSAVNPPVAHTPGNQTYNEGDYIELPCTNSGGPAEKFQWLFNSTTLNEETASILVRPSAEAIYGGNYSCTVSNAAGQSTDSMFVFIELYFSVQPKDTVGQVGKLVTLTCLAEGFPSPDQYQWSRADGEIRNDITTNTQQLQFNPFIIEDAGEYFCTALIGDDSTLSADSNHVTLSSKNNWWQSHSCYPYTGYPPHLIINKSPKSK